MFPSPKFAAAQTFLSEGLSFCFSVSMFLETGGLRKSNWWKSLVPDASPVSYPLKNQESSDRMEPEAGAGHQHYLLTTDLRCNCLSRGVTQRDPDPASVGHDLCL